MIHVGDCLEVMRALDDGSVQTCITSPPYYGLRDYGVEGQHGLELRPDCLGWMSGGSPGIVDDFGNLLGATPCGECFICTQIAVFREVRRVLRDDGTCWVNLGDSYAGAGGQSPQSGPLFKGRARQRENICTSARVRDAALKPKDLTGIPWRFALAAQADGWYLRQEIIWNKPNPMPESVRDRCTKAHEHLFLLAKSERYYFDAEAIKEPRSSAGGRGVAGWAAGPGDHSVLAHNRERGNAKTFRGGQYANGVKFDNSHATERTSTGNAPADSDNRNKRSVWTVATRPFAEAHFATFPEALVEPCILAGSRAGDLVLDPYMGAGTTAVVASRLGRRYVGAELNPEYAEIAERRLRLSQPGLALGTAA